MSSEHFAQTHCHINLALTLKCSAQVIRMVQDRTGHLKPICDRGEQIHTMEPVRLKI